MNSSRNIYTTIFSNSRKSLKQLAVLIDPDKVDTEQIKTMADHANAAQVDFLFVGGSLLFKDHLAATLKTIKQHTDIPTVLFPGSVLQICDEADAILFLSLVSGRNPELLIGQHVVAAPYLRASQLEVISTGYMLVDGGQPTTASYMSNTSPIPADKPDIAACTAMAAEYLGLKMIYLDGGSGAQQPVRPEMISAVRKAVQTPIIVGGGIRTPEAAKEATTAGADLIVVGNILEKAPQRVHAISKAIKIFSADSSLTT